MGKNEISLDRALRKFEDDIAHQRSKRVKEEENREARELEKEIASIFGGRKRKIENNTKRKQPSNIKRRKRS